MRKAEWIGTRWLGVGLAAVLAVVTISLAITGRLGLYINPDSTWFAVSMAVVVLAGAVASFALPLGAEADHGHDHGEAGGSSRRPHEDESEISTLFLRHRGDDHVRGHARAPGPSAPHAAHGFPSTRQDTPGEGPALRRVLATRGDREEDRGRERERGRPQERGRAQEHEHEREREHEDHVHRSHPLAVAATLAGGIAASGVVVLTLVLPPASLSAELAMSRDVGATPLFGGADTVQLASTGDTASFGVGEWATVFATATNPETFDGEPVELTGFVTPGEDGVFDLTRLVITHCVIDAQPASLPVVADASTPGTGQWVTITGTVRSSSDGRLVVDAAEVEEIAEPEDPYEY